MDTHEQPTATKVPTTASDSARLRATLAAVLLAVLLLPLVTDVIRLPERWEYLNPRVIGDDIRGVAESSRRKRMTSFAVGAAARAAAGGRVNSLVVPRDIESLTPSTKDEFRGVEQPTLQRRLMVPLVRGRVRFEEYDPILKPSTLARWRSQGRLLPFARSVVIVRAEDGKPTRRLRLFADESRSHLYVVPDEPGVE